MILDISVEVLQQLGRTLLGGKFRLHGSWCVKMTGPLKTHKWEAGQRRGFEIQLEVTKGTIYLGDRETTLPNKAGTVY